MSSRVRLGLAALGLGLFVATGAAHAEDAAPTAERLRSAAKEYDEGRRLFVAGEFEQSAIHFENAYNDAPRAEALRNAIRARTGAKQLARAATLASIASTTYGDDPATMTLVEETLGAMEPKLHALTISCAPRCAVAAEGRVLSVADAPRMRVYLEPGKRAVTVSFPDDRSVVVQVDAIAGGKEERAVDAPAAVAGPSVAIGTPALAPETPTRVKPFGPVVFLVAAGVTAFGAGATIISGLDAQNNPGAEAVRRDCVGLGETCATYQNGRDAQLRTNILLGATGACAVATAVIGVLFTEWSPRIAAPKVGWVPGISLGPTERALIVRGSF